MCAVLIYPLSSFSAPSPSPCCLGPYPCLTLSRAHGLLRTPFFQTGLSETAIPTLLIAWRSGIVRLSSMPYKNYLATVIISVIYCLYENDPVCNRTIFAPSKSTSCPVRVHIDVLSPDICYHPFSCSFLPPTERIR